MDGGGWLVHCINPECNMSTARLMDRLLGGLANMLMPCF